MGLGFICFELLVYCIYCMLTTLLRIIGLTELRELYLDRTAVSDAGVGYLLGIIVYRF